MISKYVREQSEYKYDDLCNNIFEGDEKLTEKIVRKLEKLGILRIKKSNMKLGEWSENLVGNIDYIDEGFNADNKFVFNFVGVIIVNGYILKCYPKYFSENLETENIKAIDDELKIVMKVIEQCKKMEPKSKRLKEQKIRLWSENDKNESFNLLSVLLYLLKDYYENGIYSNTLDVVEYNGTGEILWDKTVNEILPNIIKGKPYYLEVKTKKRIFDDYDYFKRLHECLITIASKELEEAGLLDLFGITNVDISDDELIDFGDMDYILYRIEKEIDVQFDTRKQFILKLIEIYIKKSKSLTDYDVFSLYGAKEYWYVWENVCKTIFNDMIDKEIKELPISQVNKKKYIDNPTLKILIEKPLWTEVNTVAEHTFEPDIVTIKDKKMFMIFDAKYYIPVFEKDNPPKNQPGIQDVSKQYLYQLAYEDFIKDNRFTSVHNCFLLPTIEKGISKKGVVKLTMLENFDLKNIEILFIPTKDAYNDYLNDNRNVFEKVIERLES